MKKRSVIELSRDSSTNLWAAVMDIPKVTGHGTSIPDALEHLAEMIRYEAVAAFDDLVEVKEEARSLDLVKQLRDTEKVVSEFEQSKRRLAERSPGWIAD